MKKEQVFLFFSALLLIGCKVDPEPINYGTDGCRFCSMTIVDRQHAAQIVTKKGKAYKFDATECMLHYLNELETAQIALYLVNDYNTPSELIDATKATYLISPGIPSPMGAFLTAFSTHEEAAFAQEGHTGTVYSWPALLTHFKTTNVYNK
ncbi:nitrous oxide reductase accessory protein NosL [Arenibacter sp. GZD96]|uniref:nitrous oxide reductase accessory protein NosL n=1 Tax=Aurantibrevibacter litoralis TaxID=3106030 RepID=UPI002AFE8067|nr:nitrous oxide reductase accessory protein NosL [Arenibacter sp. GZD-96]MEA1785224.1 nitrous oxide reductase accessory protein NosL [Arenibacter sp. GZD-96]